MTAIYFAIVLAFGVGLSAVILLSSRNGSKAAQLEALKAELKKKAEEQARANKINTAIAGMDEHTVRQRLHEIATKQSKRV